MSVRLMTLADLAMVLDWAAAEGWNPGLDDAAAFLAADPEGFFLWEEASLPVAAISVVNHDSDHAFLGLYLCKPEWRGQGLGYALWNVALQHAGLRSIGLDGVAAQQANYARSGFALKGSTIRLEGHLPAKASPNTRAIRPDDLPILLALDAVANGYERKAFLKVWLKDTETRQTLVQTNAGQIAGFVTIRACQEGHKIGHHRPFSKKRLGFDPRCGSGCLGQQNHPRSAVRKHAPSG